MFNLEKRFKKPVYLKPLNHVGLNNITISRRVIEQKFFLK